MASDRIQADYDSLSTIARQMDQEGQDVETLARRIRLLVEDLERGGWRGMGARAFYDEMYMDVLPGLRRLHDALYASSDAVTQIMTIIQEAEEEAARRFK